MVDETRPCHFLRIGPLWSVSVMAIFQQLTLVLRMLIDGDCLRTLSYLPEGYALTSWTLTAISLVYLNE